MSGRNRNKRTSRPTTNIIVIDLTNSSSTEIKTKLEDLLPVMLEEISTEVSTGTSREITRLLEQGNRVVSRCLAELESLASEIKPITNIENNIILLSNQRRTLLRIENTAIITSATCDLALKLQPQDKNLRESLEYAKKFAESVRININEYLKPTAQLTDAEKPDTSKKKGK